MRAPLFWSSSPDDPGLRARLLAPFSMLYAAATAHRVAKGPIIRLAVPVICIGNLNAGGTGKTPTAITVVHHLTERGMNPHVITRGYGGSLRGPVKVDERSHTAGQVGDEPLLLAAFCPTWVSRDRAEGANAAVAAGADIVILDDGFQNPALGKDISIIVVDAKRGFGNGRVLPAGPLRETLEVGLKRADFVLAIGNEISQKKFDDSWRSQIPVPVLRGQLRPLETGMDWNELRVFAFAGIGDPAKFFSTLTDLGADIVRTEALADHQPLSPQLMRRLISEAKELSAQLVTTEKDAVRLPKEFRQQVLTVPVRLELFDWIALDDALDRFL